MWLDERPAQSIHLAVQSAGVAQIVTRTISSPQGGLHRAAVNTLSALRQLVQHISRGPSHIDGCASTLQTVKHGVVKRSSRPSGGELGGHVRCIRASIGSIKRSGQRGVLVSATDSETAAVTCIPGRSIGHGRAGGVVVPARGMRATTAE